LRSYSRTPDNAAKNMVLNNFKRTRAKKTNQSMVHHYTRSNQRIANQLPASLKAQERASDLCTVSPQSLRSQTIEESYLCNHEID
jgi:hypothetical protein